MNGQVHLLDANIDWGQDFIYLRDWCNAHRESSRAFLAHFTFVSPKVVGINCRPMPRNGAAGPSSIGDYVISVNELHGYKHFGDTGDYYEWLRTVWPLARVGYSIQVFRITKLEASGEPHAH